MWYGETNALRARSSSSLSIAVTKHLRVLERAKIVHSVRAGRENLFEFDPTPIREVREYADVVSAQWDQALARLKAFVEA
jgi:DNA-binding transcriptional ArsR family regulator